MTTEADDLTPVVDEVTALRRALTRLEYAISHDLRAPLRKIVGMSQMLLREQDSGLSDVARDRLRRIDGATQRLQRMVEGILVLSRLQRHELRPQSVDLAEAARAAWCDAQHQLGVPETPLTTGNLGTVRADPVLVRIVLHEFLSNALSATAATGGSPASIDVHRQDMARPAEKPVVRMEVRDRGVGVRADSVDRAPDLFCQLHRRDVFPGVGAGLAIAARAAARMGGMVRLQARGGGGAVAILELPNTAAGPAVASHPPTDPA